MSMAPFARSTDILSLAGIYRKTGGANQVRIITSLFERGDYDSFDLLDQNECVDLPPTHACERRG